MTRVSRKYPRNLRMRKRGEFMACYEAGKRFHSAHFLLFCQRAQNGAAFGVAVSRKVGNAVRRNRIKRLLREFYRLCPADLSGCRLVVVAKKGAGYAGLNLDAVREELMPLVRRALDSGGPEEGRLASISS